MLIIPIIGFPINFFCCPSLAVRRIIISANAAWNLSNFRAGLLRGLMAKGYEVLAAAPPDTAAEKQLAALGCRFASVPIDSQGISPLRDLATFAAYLRLFRRERPAVYLGYTIKPNSYGALAARLCGIPSINNISGLGTAFIRRSWLTAAARILYRIGLARAHTVFFQNETDRQLFVTARIVRPDQALLLPGSGIDGERFAAAPARNGGARGEIVFLLIARLVRDKGVYEYVEAARLARARDPRIRCRILGFLDVANRTAIDRATVDAWAAEGAIDYLGAVDDVRPSIVDADCVVLPSYREGTSRVLLEAAAMARPLVATDVPGCREVVDAGRSGLLCAPRDAPSLAQAMLAMAALDDTARAAMGTAGREKVLREFDEQFVVQRYLDRIADALNG